MSDRTALLAAIAAHPDEDTPRLALADLLDETGDPAGACEQRLAVALRKVCAAPADDAPRLEYAEVLERYAGFRTVCSGTHRHAGKMGFNHGVWHDLDPNYPHHHCDEKCRVSDGKRERAEFIRVQCELARLPPGPVEVGVLELELDPPDSFHSSTSLRRPGPDRFMPAVRTGTLRCRRRADRGDVVEVTTPLVRFWALVLDVRLLHAVPTGEFELRVRVLERDPDRHRARRKTLQDREYALWREHGAAFAAGLPGEAPAILPGCRVSAGVPTPIGYVFRRGFVGETTCSAADWLADGDAITAGHPVETVTLTTWPEGVATRAARLRDWKRPPRLGGHVLDSWRAEWPRVKVWNLPGAADLPEVTHWAMTDAEGNELGRATFPPAD